MKYKSSGSGVAGGGLADFEQVASAAVAVPASQGSGSSGNSLTKRGSAGPTLTCADRVPGGGRFC